MSPVVVCLRGEQRSAKDLFRTSVKLARGNGLEKIIRT